ncbi:aminodeoxychorismate/anthranilate synthase component II [Aureimonas fodinaquatilis]|uniref:Aminodeoxychorismate/anthranilate synthase component II n=1 Tax=Aureimonas fodinaquatilis TaxID=2565783 RepID=A0A5B0E2T8_9HYPH|nr:aminodeoxychorismate/anthranilate synthase component II [Aureimonas fodinaquatilis]KAA0971739.1 aminodeoxychorismate/anthranilate synthase component II [Aureimonas fodinaquatilis]
MILIIDNYDSFVFNIARYFERLGQTVQVVRNDDVSAESLMADMPEALVVSPGPCSPLEAGASLPIVQALSGKLPILGVCLGHQVIGAAFGGEVTRAHRPLHGQASVLEHTGEGLFAGLPHPATGGRYHSLIVRETPAMLSQLRIDARSAEGEIMALSHRQHPTYGIQFHPESVLTPDGLRIIENFLSVVSAVHLRQPAIPA